jgi:hypothetical protein
MQHHRRDGLRAYRLLEFCRTYRVGKDRAYADIRSGTLIARKVGKNTIILADDAEAYIAALPRLELPPTPETEAKAPRPSRPSSTRVAKAAQEAARAESLLAAMKQARAISTAPETADVPPSANG